LNEKAEQVKPQMKSNGFYFQSTDIPALIRSGGGCHNSRRLLRQHLMTTKHPVRCWFFVQTMLFCIEKC